MKQGTKRVKWWCSSCDRTLVTAGTKCKVCGVRAIKKPIKVNTKLLMISQ